MYEMVGSPTSYIQTRLEYLNTYWRDCHDFFKETSMDICGFEWNTLRTVGWIAMTSCLDINVLHRLSNNNLNPLLPPEASHLCFWFKWFNNLWVGCHDLDLVQTFLSPNDKLLKLLTLCLHLSSALMSLFRPPPHQQYVFFPTSKLDILCHRLGNVSDWQQSLLGCCQWTQTAGYRTKSICHQLHYLRTGHDWTALCPLPGYCHL